MKTSSFPLWPWPVALAFGMALVPFVFRAPPTPTRVQLPTPPIESPPAPPASQTDCRPPTPLSEEDTTRLRLAHYLFNATTAWMEISLSCVEAWGAGPDPVCHSPPTCKTWSSTFDPKREQESLPDVVDRIFQTSNQVAGTALKSDPVSFPGHLRDDDRSRTGLLLMSVAFHESRFRGYVDDERCNDPAWRQRPDSRPLLALGGSCDGGLARSMWQLHGFAGGQGRGAAIEEALRRIRAGFRSGVGLRWYTGEGVVSGFSPKSWAREHLASQWAHRHPYSEWSCGENDPTDCSREIRVTP